jgi:hypothetical protein
MNSAKILIVAMMLALAVSTTAAPPNLTSGGVPGDTISFNMGATGARGWAYHVSANTSESRQILIHTVAAGSPSAGILAANDVILGADGSGAAPINFTYDARHALADAINAAEARSPATLQLIRWRAGTISTGSVPNIWVRLVRSGTIITAYKSTNGTTWTTVGSTILTTFASNCYIGLAVGSGSDTTLNTSQFSNVSVTP